MWRIGQLASMTGVSQRTLHHYDKIGLLAPAACDPTNGYRWYGVAELVRLERIRGLQRLGLPLHQIADVIEAPEPQLRQAVADAVTRVRGDIAALELVAAQGEDHLNTPMSVLPQLATLGVRHLVVRRLQVDPSELAETCTGASILVTWLSAEPTGSFAVAVATRNGGESLTLPPRTVARAVVPPTTGVVRAGQDLFKWLRRHDLAVAGPTLEEHLRDGDGAQATVLDVPVRSAANDRGSPPGRLT
jgi:DNA-binding transcriptional MerR regulator